MKRAVIIGSGSATGVLLEDGEILGAGTHPGAGVLSSARVLHSIVPHA